MILDKKYMFLIFFFVFSLISCFFISPREKIIRGQKRASSLQKKIVEEDGKVKTFYVDENGDLSFAADVRYAMKIVSKNESGENEEYFDENGDPAMNSSGCYGIFKEYDENRNILKITYLGRNKEIIVNNYGYSIGVRKLDEGGKLVEEYYYDAFGKPVCTKYWGYGKRNEYDDNGRIYKVSYMNLDGELLVTSQGYASIVQIPYTSDDFQNGKTEYEFYYDANGKPTSLQLGQYGVHKVYNTDGLVSTITYLNSDGNPMVTKKGYSTIKRTFYADNSVKTERYFDIEGNPFRLPEGQYGIIRDLNGKLSYLDAYGDLQPNFKNVVYNNSFLVFVCAGTIILGSVLFKQRLNMLLLIIYVWFILYFTLLNRESSETQMNLVPFRSYGQLFHDNKLFSSILRNIWLFIPLGTILFQLYPKKVVLFIPIILSILIESVQYFTNMGIYDVDDVISNSIGGSIGFELGCILTSPVELIRKNSSQTLRI